MLLDLRSNLRQAWRTLRRERGVTVVAVGSLAIGLAANAVIFSLIQAVMFPSLIYPDASRIVFVESRNARGLDGIWSMYQWLDRAPLGRNEDQGVWWRRNDEYGKR